MINGKADEVIEEHFLPILSRYQTVLEASMKGSDFVFDCVRLLYYKCHEINPNRGGSNVRSLYKNATINSINKKDNKYLQYAVTVALNHEDIREKITKNLKKFSLF